MYKVIRFFTDLQDKEHPYNVGDIFPREGIDATGARLKELAGSENRQGAPLIKLAEERPAKEEKQEVSKEGSPKQKRRKPASE